MYVYSWVEAKKIQLQSTKMNKLTVMASSAKIVAIQQKTNFNKDGSWKYLQATADICMQRRRPSHQFWLTYDGISWRLHVLIVSIYKKDIFKIVSYQNICTFFVWIDAFQTKNSFFLGYIMFWIDNIN